MLYRYFESKLNLIIKFDFDKIKYLYQDSLKKSNYSETLQFEDKNLTNKKRRVRKRKIIYFQPPYSMEVKTKIGSSFLKLVKKHFTSDHPLHKILNHRSLKLSYSCLPNVKNMISSHNKKLLTKPTNLSSRTCNCNNKQDCPLEGKCLQSNLIYQANITTETLEQ